MKRQHSSYAKLRWSRPARDLAAVGPARATELEPAADLAASALVRAVRAFGEPLGDGSPAAQAVQLLQAAAEIEQQLMVEYLYAYSSLAGNAPAPWRTKLRTVFKEEMGHLLTVQNLLLLVGAAPHLARMSGLAEEDEPFPLRLEPFQTSSLAKYVAAESPDPDDLPPDIAQQAAPAYVEAAENGFTDNRVGLLYAKIYWMFQTGDAPEGPWLIPPGTFTQGGHVAESALHPESIHFQGIPDAWNVGDGPQPQGGRFAMRVPDRPTALAAIHAVAQQGEGLVPTGPGEPSHFQQFLEIYIAAKAIIAAGQALPVLPVPTNPTYGPDPSPDGALEENRIAEEISQLWAALFDAHYTVLLGVIHLSLLIPDTAAGEPLREELASHALRSQMVDAIARIARALVGRPRIDGLDATVKAAAPPFSNPIVPASGDQMILAAFLRTKLDESDDLIGKLAPTPPLPALLQTILLGNTDLRALLSRLPVS